MKTFTLDGHSSSEWNIGLSGSGTYGAPARKGESISVPGRNGALWVDDGSFENTIVTYPCWMCEDFDTEFDDFRAFLAAHGDKYYRLTDDYHPNEYRMARWLGPLDPDVSTQNKSGRFNVEFDCQPQRFLTSGEAYITIDPSGTIITNPTQFFCFPKIKTSNGGGHAWVSFSRTQLYPDGNTYTSAVKIRVPVSNRTMWTDTQTLVSMYTEELTNLTPSYSSYSGSEIQVDLSDDIFKHGEISLYPGENTISYEYEPYSSETCTIELAPRWWTI